MNPLPNTGNDPYKAPRKSRSPGHKQRSEHHGHSRPNYDNNGGQFASQSNDGYTDDPYAPHLTTQRHYTPHDTHSTRSSNNSSPHRHQRRPKDYPSRQGNPYPSNPQFQPSPASSMYQDGDPLPSYASPSRRNDAAVYAPQDNSVLDIDDSAPLQAKERATTTTTDTNAKKKRRLKCCCGPKYVVAGTFAFIGVVVLVWYFVWPRAFEMDLGTVSLYGNNTNAFTTSSTGITTQFQTVWNVSMIADNKDNWVPTQVASLNLVIIDHDTGIRFANASSGAFVLGAKERKPIHFDAIIDYQRATNEETMDDLVKACAVQSGSGQPQTKTSLNLLFQVSYHISGFIWSYQTQTTSSYFLCP